MARGRKPFTSNTIITWEDIFWKNISTYINILNNYLSFNGFELIEVGNTIEKNIFKIPKGLNSKEINQTGVYPVISQSKEFIIGFSDNSELLVKDNFPLIVFGDHSKTIKFIEEPFIIGADGVKILKPKSDYNEKFFYYFLHGVITDTKDYGRHYSLLRKGSIANVKDIVLQKSIVGFLDNLKDNSISYNHIFFNQDIERKIISLQISQYKQLDISSELTHQLNLIKQLRQAFLREAMQGKLCQAEPVEAQETGQQLLAQIKIEKVQLIADRKLKKEKELPQIIEEEIPFEIPEDWTWCRLGEIVLNFQNGISSRGETDGDMITVLRLADIKLSKVDLTDLREIKLLKNIYNRYLLNEYDILITRVNGSLDLVGNFNFVGKSGMKLAACDHFVRMQLSQNLNSYFIFLLGNMLHIRKSIEDNFKTTSGQKTVNQGHLNNLLIALPPLHEQEQIVAKLEELMVYCDGLEQSIKESQGYNEILLQQVLREALQGEKV